MPKAAWAAPVRGWVLPIKFHAKNGGVGFFKRKEIDVRWWQMMVAKMMKKDNRGKNRERQGTTFGVPGGGLP